jgi:hypothetical protein
MRPRSSASSLRIRARRSRACWPPAGSGVAVAVVTVVRVGVGVAATRLVCCPHPANTPTSRTATSDRTWTIYPLSHDRARSVRRDRTRVQPRDLRRRGPRRRLQGRRRSTLEVLLAHGINHIDVVASYGDAELRIATWLKEHEFSSTSAPSRLTCRPAPATTSATAAPKRAAMAQVPAGRTAAGRRTDERRRKAARARPLPAARGHARCGGPSDASSTSWSMPPEHVDRDRRCDSRARPDPYPPPERSTVDAQAHPAHRRRARARRAADRTFVQQAVEQLRSSDGWQRWLTTRRHFHTYCILISGPVSPTSVERCRLSMTCRR